MGALLLKKSLIGWKSDMVANVVIPDDVEAQIREIGDYIAQDNPPAALAMVRGLRARCQSLDLFPERGAPYGERYRRLFEGPYQIIYRVEDAAEAATVIIVAVHHMSRQEPTDL